jgi:putative restriction endonuclease
MHLEDLLAKLYNLKRDSGSGWEKPYKPALILTLIDLIEQSNWHHGQGHPELDCREHVKTVARANRFSLSDPLIARYREYIAVVGREGDHSQIHYPFWHLCGDGIWMINAREGGPLYRPGDNAASSPSVKWIRERMSHASLNTELFRYLNDPVEREHIRLALIARYFPAQRDALLSLISQYHHVEKVAEDPREANTDPVRTAAFARVVKDIYDYRCAASGVRFRLDDLTIVDACHLIPFAETGNDHPSNGIALSKNHHWALDRHLIAPCATETKLIWRVAPCLDDRLEGHRELLKLEGRSVLLPPAKEKRFWPSEEGMQWRLERLRVAG